MQPVNDRQRVLMVVAVGLGLAVVARTLVSTLVWDDLDGGWFAYAPGTSPIFSRPSGDVRPGVIWLAAIVLWAAVSYRILRTPGR